MLEQKKRKILGPAKKKKNDVSITSQVSQALFLSLGGFRRGGAGERLGNETGEVVIVELAFASCSAGSGTVRCSSEDGTGET